MYQRRIISVFVLVFLLISIPYLAGVISGGNEFVFTGFLSNPLDGNSYLAKMIEGYQGDLSFKLPYSIDPGEGSYIFLFYIFLGHIARFLNVEPMIIFHLTRIITFIFLYFVLYQFIQHFFEKDREKTWLTFIIVSFGSGMGWLALSLGLKTSDLWVAEAYPFLSVYQNPHFPLSLGLMLLILVHFFRTEGRASFIWIFFSSLVLAIILPFGAVVIGLVIFLEQTWSYFQKERIQPVKILILMFGSLPVVIYQYYLVNTHPQLIIWNEQNRTPSPPLWDFFLSFSPVLILAIIYIATKLKSNKFDLFKLLTVWTILGLVIIYLPIGIQRRFMVGYFIPISILASAFIFTFENKKLRAAGFATLLASSLMTISFILLAGISGIGNHNPLLFLSKPEAESLKWFKANGFADQVVLADDRMGMFIPAHTFLRVIYGHPFETINAERSREIVEKFFGCEFTPDQADEVVSKFDINYILLNQNDPKICYPKLFKNADLQFRANEVTQLVEIYKIK